MTTFTDAELTEIVNAPVCTGHERSLAAALLEARRLLYDAADTIQSWGDYASPYFQEKHKLADDVARFRRAAIAEGKA